VRSTNTAPAFFLSKKLSAMSYVSRVTLLRSTSCVENPLLTREQWVDDWVDTSTDESLEDFKGNT